MENKRKVVFFFAVLAVFGISLALIQANSFGTSGLVIGTSDTIVNSDTDLFDFKGAGILSFAFVIVVFAVYLLLKFLSKHNQKIDERDERIRHFIKLDTTYLRKV